MTAQSARAALIELASTWRTRGANYHPGAGALLGCAQELDEVTVTHLAEHGADRPIPGIGRLRRASSAFDRAMAAELIPGHIRQRVINRVLYGNPDGPS